MTWRKKWRCSVPAALREQISLFRTGYYLEKYFQMNDVITYHYFTWFCEGHRFHLNIKTKHQDVKKQPEMLSDCITAGGAERSNR